MLTLSNIIKDVEKAFKLRCVSPEYEILLLLYECGSGTPNELLKIHESAGSTFFAALKRLHDKGLVCAERDPADRRLVRYSMADSARAALDAKRDRILAWANDVAVRERSTRGQASG